MFNKRGIGKSRVRDFKRNIELTLLALPTIIYVIIFSYIPLYGLLLPFKNYSFRKGILGSTWVGFENFKFLLNSDLLRITSNTLVMNFLFIVFNFVFDVLLALLLFELSKKATKRYQLIMFLPYFLSWAVVSYAVMAFLDGDYGIVNKVLQSLGREPVSWYSSPQHWRWILVGVHLWKNLGYGVIMYYSSLLTIDSAYYEAAELDGAGKIQQAIHISIPLIKPTIIILLILSIGNIFYSDFGLFYTVPLNSSLLYPTVDVIDTYVFRALRQLGDFGMSSAAGLFQSVCGFILVMCTNWIVGKISNEDKLF